jgi:hypothetical protein
MKGNISYGNATMELWKGMLEGKVQHKRFSKVDYGGRRYSRMLKFMLGLVVFVNEYRIHHVEMNYLFNWLDIVNVLKLHRIDLVGS